MKTTHIHLHIKRRFTFIITSFLLCFTSLTYADNSDDFHINTLPLFSKTIGEMSTGRVMIEISNHLSQPANNIVLSILEPAGNQVGRGAVQAGSVDAGEIRVINTDFISTVSSKADVTLWQLEYDDAAGNKHTTVVSSKHENN